MDELSSSIPWPAIPVIFGLAVAGTVWGLQKLKMLAYASKHWTRYIPRGVWLVLSIVLPFGLVILLSQPWVFGWMNQFLPAEMQVNLGGEEMLGIGVSAVFGGQGAYPLAKKSGLIGDYADIPNGYEKSQSGNVTTQSGNVAGANAAGSATAGNQTEGSPATATEEVIKGLLIEQPPCVSEAPAHWPTAKILEDITPYSTKKRYYILLDKEPYEVERDG